MQKLILIRDSAGVLDLIEYIKDKTAIAVDCETTGVLNTSEVIGISICAERDVGYYIITAEWKDSSLNYLHTKEYLPQLLRCLGQHPLIMHNGIFDCNMIKQNYKVSLIESLHTDTMLLAHTLDENRRVGLKDLAYEVYGASAKKEQEEMKTSVLVNGGQLTKNCYELYKADSELIGRYGAKDAILTYNLFYEMGEQLIAEKLDGLFYDEVMPLLKGPTYDLNTIGLKVDPVALAKLKLELEVEIMELQGFIYKEIDQHIKDKYPGTNKKNSFNIGSSNQLAWLLFDKLGNEFPKLSDEGRDLAKTLQMQVPYSPSAKRNFIAGIKCYLGHQWRAAKTIWDKKTKRFKGKAKVKDYWTYLSTDKTVLQHFANKYAWVEKLLLHKKLKKLLSTYVEGIEKLTQYGVIRPSFLQHGTTSGRYSSRHPNFQNLPRDDKRVKSCIIARLGQVFVGADYSQLEPRVFASFSKDKRLLDCFRTGDDFYSVIGVEIFNKFECSLKKDESNSFAKKYPKLRDIAKMVALSATYGTTAVKMAPSIGKTVQEAQEIIDNYFEKFPQVQALMIRAHDEVKSKGIVHNLFGRPRRIPQALEINKQFPGLAHAELPYDARNLLNLAINHTIQSTGASIINRASIALYETIQKLGRASPHWQDVKIVLQVHDELVLEGPEHLGDDMAYVLKAAMENTVTLPGVSLVAEPKIGRTLAELK